MYIYIYIYKFIYICLYIYAGYDIKRLSYRDTLYFLYLSLCLRLGLFMIYFLLYPFSLQLVI